MNLFNFDAEAAETTAFDVKPCFSWEEQRFIQFALNGECDIWLCNLLKGIKNILILRIWRTSWVDRQVQLLLFRA